MTSEDCAVIDDLKGVSSCDDDLEQDLEETTAHQKEETLTVAQAMRKHSGRIEVSGMIVTMSELYALVTEAKWRCYGCGYEFGRLVRKITEPPYKPKQCPSCGSKLGDFEDLHKFTNVVDIAIQQSDITENTLDNLSAVLFEKDTEEIRVGENVKIIGRIEKVQDKRNRKYRTVILAESIQYERRNKHVLTDNDIVGIKRFAGRLPINGNAYLLNYRDRLVKMFAPNVIGHNDKKLALILATIGAPEDRENGVRGRINVLLIGPPGLAKTKLGREVIQLRPNSRYVSGKNTTGRSLTAMILPEDEKLVLHLGPVPLARNAICYINEFDKVEPKEQDNLLEVMEEGIIPINKFAKLLKLKAPTTIVASANPKNNKWLDMKKISLDEIPFSSIILNRFDLVLPFRDTADENYNREFADKKTEYDEKQITHNYNFLEKYIDYARTIKPAITEEARTLLNEYWVRLKGRSEVLSTPRTLETIHRISKAIARINLVKVVDIQIAYATIDFMNKMLEEFHCQIYYVPEPKSTAYDETIRVIQDMKGEKIDLIYAIKIACEKNYQVGQYIGSILKQSGNIRLRHLCEKITENPSVIIVQAKPTVVIWRCGQGQENNQNNNDKNVAASDTSDICDSDNLSEQQEFNTFDSNNVREESEKISLHQENTRSHVSHISLGTKNETVIVEDQVEQAITCSYCNYKTSTENDRVKHSIIKHPGKSVYPEAWRVKKEEYRK